MKFAGRGRAGRAGWGGIVASFGRDDTRVALFAAAVVPLLPVHGGLRPRGLAPERTPTRFSWSLADA
jgi:hypothetical protein